MPAENLIKLYPEEKYYAKCPECGGWEWALRLDGVGIQWSRIIGTECLDPDCDFFCDWIEVVRIRDEPRCKEVLSSIGKYIFLGRNKKLDSWIEALKDLRILKRK